MRNISWRRNAKLKKYYNTLKFKTLNTYVTKFKQHVSEGTVGTHTIHRSGGTAKASLAKLQREIGRAHV